MRKTPVRSYRKRDGTTVRAHSRRVPGKRAAAGVAVTVTIAVAGVSVAATSGGDAATGGARAAPRPPAKPAQSSARAKAEIDFKRIALKVESKGYSVTVRTAQDTNCAAHSYGQVQVFFKSAPCDLLSRAVIEIHDKRQDVVLIAVSRVAMPSTAQAKKYKVLVDRPGTGNITELSREVGPYQQVRFTGDIYTSSIEGVIVRNTQVQPVLGELSTQALKEIQRTAG